MEAVDCSVAKGDGVDTVGLAADLRVGAPVTLRLGAGGGAVLPDPVGNGPVKVKIEYEHLIMY